MGFQKIFWHALSVEIDENIPQMYALFGFPLLTLPKSYSENLLYRSIQGLSGINELIKRQKNNYLKRNVKTFAKKIDPYSDFLKSATGIFLGIDR